MSDETYKPQHLGKHSAEPVDHVDLIPWIGTAIEIELRCDEFTSLCPVTGQPDFGGLTITYVPRGHIVESKSLKLYLLRYRNMGVFNEAVVTQIADDLWEQLEPERIEVEGRFKSRGGISITARARRPSSEQ